jgi:ABC-2 type transport system permease protein
MNRTLLVAWQEYRKHVFNKRFLLGLLSVPLVILAMVGLVFLMMSLENNTGALGYVDYSGLLANPLPAPAPEKPDKPVTILPFDSEVQAEAALTAGEIQGYYIIPADYLSTGSLEVVTMGTIKSPARRQFYDLLSTNILRDTDPQVAARLTEGAEVVVVSPDGSRIASSENWFNILLPMLSGLAFMIIMFSTGGYLMQAVVDEKENRTMEVIITSISPNQFMAGKIIGDISIGLTQILLWMLFIVIVVLVGRDSIDFLRSLQIAPQTILLLVVVMFPAFVMVAALMAAVGATVAEAREGQQVIGLLAMPVWIPYMMMGLIMSNPNSPLAVALSLLPMTAPLTMLMRAGFTILPAWQIALSACIQVIFAVGAIWLAGRAFRLGMLRYGKRLKWREVFARQQTAAAGK